MFIHSQKKRLLKMVVSQEMSIFEKMGSATPRSHIFATEVTLIGLGEVITSLVHIKIHRLKGLSPGIFQMEFPEVRNPLSEKHVFVRSWKQVHKGGL